MTRHSLTAAMLVTVATAMPTHTAVASRAPSATERAAIAQFFQAPRRCLRIRVATVRRGWASATYRTPIRASCMRYVANGITVLRRRDDVWRQRWAGSSWSCPIPEVPEDVRKDL